MHVRGSVALVTGANRGIGRALVESLLANGVQKVYAAARRETDLEPIVALDERRVIAVAIDVTDVNQLENAAQSARDVNLLFNNAGVLAFGSVLDVPTDAFKHNFDVNTFGLLNATRAFAPALEQNRGAVVNILTLVALASMPGLGVYNASKAAAWSLTQSLRADLAKRGIKVFSVFPGAVDTDMTKGFAMPKATPQAVAEEIVAGLLADSEDIFPDPMSKQVYSQWTADHKSIEQQFAAM
jgi:NAD(P)-dependent dehydrogenase (short-subunit alcohol dehydrogenase family)